MNPRQQEAENRMVAAKAKFTEAARAALAGDPKASELARSAFRQVSEARSELQALEVRDE